MTNRIIKFLFLFSGIMALTFSAVAGKRYWVGTGSNKNWNSTGNWSSTSGGSSGSTVPGTSDTAYFDGSGLGQCSINATASVRRFEMGAGYTDTVKQTTFTLSTGAGGMILNGGVFWGGSVAVTVGGVFTLSGTNFKSTSATLSISGNYNFSSGTFTHNNGNVTFNASLSITGSTNFYDFSISGTNTTLTMDALSTFNVSHLLTQSSGAGIVINTGTINVQGDITQASTSVIGGGTGTICINGTGTQNFNGSASLSLNGRLCNIKINKTSGTLYLKDYIRLVGTWEYVQGTVDVSTYTSTVVFPFSNNTIKGTQSFYSVYLATTVSTNTLTVQSGDTLTVLNTLTTDGSSAVALVGQIYLHGDIVVNNTNNTSGTSAGAGVIHITGTGSQTITGAASLGAGRLCSITVDKPSGTLTLKNYVNVWGDWTHVRGTVDASTYSSTVGFVYGTRTISGKPSFYNVSFFGQATSTNTISDTLTVNGTLTNESSNSIALNTGVINVKGDVTINNTNNSATTTGGTATLLFSTSGNQTINGASSIGAGRLCNVKINKPSGTLTLKNIVNVGGDWTYLGGTMDVSTYTSTVCFAYSTGRTISGVQNFYNLHFYSPTACTNSISDTLTVLGELKTSGTFGYLINSGTINATGNVTLANIASAAGGGSGWINICGTGNQTLRGSGVIIGGCLCNTKINKNSGTLYLTDTISLHSSSVWRYIKGTVDPLTSSFYAIGGADIDCDNGASYMTFNNFGISGGATATLSGVLRARGGFFIQAARTLNTNSNNIEVGGNWDASGTFTSGTSKVTLNGAGNQFLIHPTGATGFYDLEINKPSGKFYFQSSSLQANHSLTLTKGIIASSSSKLLILVDNATIAGGSDSSYVSGPFKKIGNDAFTFPLGDTLAGSGAYHPLKITAPAVVTDAFTSQYFYANQTQGSTIQTDSLSSISNCENWLLTRVVGSSTVVPSLGWNTSSCNVDGCDILRVAGWNASNSRWESLGYNGLTGSGSSGFVNAHSGLSVSSLPLVIAKRINPSLRPTVTVTGNLSICSGSDTTLTASGATTYSWSPSTGLSATTGSSVTAGPTVTTTYTVIGANASGCSDTAMVTVTVNPRPTVSLDSAVSICYGNDTTLTASGATTYTWSPGTGLSATTGASVTAGPTVTTTYTVIGTNASGCKDTATIIVRVNPLPTVTSSSVSICYGTGTTLTASGADTFSWSPGTGLSATTGASVTANPVVTTTYTITGTDSLGCAGIVLDTVMVDTLPIVTVSADTSICLGDSILLSASGASTYSWSPDLWINTSTGANVTAFPFATIIYIATGTNADGCTDTDSVTVTVRPLPDVSVAHDTTMLAGDMVSLRASGASTYSWSPPTGLSATTGTTVIASPTVTTVYTATGTDSTGCANADSAVVTIASCLTLVLPDESVCRQTPVTITGSAFDGCTISVAVNFGDGYSAIDTTDVLHPLFLQHLYSVADNYTVIVTALNMDGSTFSRDTLELSVVSCNLACESCIPSFSPLQTHKYVLSAWVSQSGAAVTATTFTTPEITVSTSIGGLSVSMYPSGDIIDGWQKIEGEFTMPGSATDINIQLNCTSGDCYFDDIRVFPFDGSMKSYVYDPVSMRLVAELDERNYATLYEYDEEGKLVRVKKETEKGIMTIKENRNNTSK